MGDTIFNSAAVLREGEVLAMHRKWMLPNYSVFDEKRYFQPGNEPTVFRVGDLRIGLIICEDVWFREPAMAAAIC